MTETAHLHDPQTLYRHWEGEQWNPWAIDLATDKAQWGGALSERDKSLVYWALSSLMVAEERITTKFAGLVMAAENEEEASYLASHHRERPRTDGIRVHHPLPAEERAAPGLRRRLQPHPPRRATTHRLRRLVPPVGGAR